MKCIEYFPASWNHHLKLENLVHLAGQMPEHAPARKEQLSCKLPQDLVLSYESSCSLLIRASFQSLCH